MQAFTYILPIRPIAIDMHVHTSHFADETSGTTYEMASLLMNIVDWLLGIFNLEHNQTIVTILYAAVVTGISFIVGYIVKWIVLSIVREVAKRWNNSTYKYLTSANFFSKLCRIIPALFFLMLITFSLPSKTQFTILLTKATNIYILILIAIAISAFVKAIWQRIDSRENKRKLPLNGIAQLIKGIVWIITIIIIIAIIFDKSPASLLAGMGAFSAVLMLIFKDNILGVVAGVQLSENDSLHVGDWITVGGTEANGIVTEVTLTSVKILNWDKTTTTLPPYSLISGSFTNYRSMQQSNTRRICRCYMIDADSIMPTTPQMLDNIRKVKFMDEYITKKLDQKAKDRVSDVDNPDGLVNGTIDTNLGLFRAYMKMWLDNNPHISHTSDCFVSSLAQTSAGIPFRIYCFTNTSAWFAYEAIQDSIMEHVAAMLSIFGLYAFENPSGRDTVVDGYLSPGNDIDKILGIPYPFFRNPDAPIDKTKS